MAAAWSAFWGNLGSSGQKSLKKYIQTSYNNLAGRKATELTDADYGQILDGMYQRLEKLGYVKAGLITKTGEEAGLGKQDSGMAGKRSKVDTNKLKIILDAPIKGTSSTNIKNILTREDLGGRWGGDTAKIQDNITETQTAQADLKKFLDINKPDGVSDEEWRSRSKDLTDKFWEEYNGNIDYTSSDVIAKLSKDFSQALETPEETAARQEMEEANKDVSGTTTEAGTEVKDLNGDGKITAIDKTLTATADAEKAERAKLAAGLEEGRTKALSEVLGGIDQARGKVGEYQQEYTQALENYNKSQEPELLRQLKEAGVAGAGLNAGGVQAGIAEALMNQRAQAGVQGAQYGLDLRSQLDQAQLNAQSQYAGLGAQNAAMVGQYGYDEGMYLQNTLVQNYLNQFGYQAQMAAMQQTQRYGLLNQNIQNSYNTTSKATDFQNQMTMMQQQYEYNKALQNQNKSKYSGLGSSIGSFLGGASSLMSGFGDLYGSGFFAKPANKSNSIV